MLYKQVKHDSKLSVEIEVSSLDELLIAISNLELCKSLYEEDSVCDDSLGEIARGLNEIVGRKISEVLDDDSLSKVEKIDELGAKFKHLSRYDVKCIVDEYESKRLME